MRKLLAMMQRYRQARIDREALARLDARTLRDIGMQSWSAELSGRVEAERQRQLLRLAVSRIGTY